MGKPVGVGRNDVQGSGAAVVLLPSMKKEQKRFVLLQKDASDQHKTRFEFYVGAMDQPKPSETWDIGVDFTMTVSMDQEEPTIEVTRKDKQTCKLTFYKAPCTKDVKKGAKQFVDGLQFLGDMKEAKLKPLNSSVHSDDPTLDVQTKGNGSASGAGGGSPKGSSSPSSAAASPTSSSKGGGGGGDEGTTTEPKPGLLETLKKEKDGTTSLNYENVTTDMQFKVTYTFKNVEGALKPNKNCTKVSDNKYSLDIYPCETVEFARGKWNGQTRGIGSGKPDKKWLEKQTKASREALEKEIKDLMALIKKSGVKKITAEGIAELCVKNNRKFIDLTFPPTTESLFRSWEKGMTDTMWQRPSEYLAPGVSPALFVGSVEPEDIDQGSLGDCYFLSALACLSEFEPLVLNIFDEGQDYDRGIYRATLCKNGWWQTVTLDEFLPSNGGGPCFAKNREEPNELWVALLEKAYAKLHGSYGSIRAGSGGMALADLTGCPYELFDESKMTPELFKVLEENDRNDYIQMLGTPGKDTSDYAGGAGSKSEADLSKKYEAVGLACGHAYSLITVKEYKGNQLVMIRNPWGNDKEWNGDWSDKSSKWTKDIKEAVGWYDGDDGTFWMCWKDVCKWFTSASVCYANGAWDQVRVAAAFDEGVTDLCLQIDLKKDSAAWIGAHQRDTRGVKKGDAEDKYIAIQVNLLREDAGKMVVVHSPPFKPGRDQNREVKFKKSEGTRYYFFVQTTDQSASRSIVYSIHAEMSEFADIKFLTPKTPKRYNPITNFDPKDWEPTEAIYQIKGLFTTNGGVVERQGAYVDFSNAKKVLTAKEKEIKTAPGNKKGLGQYASFPLEVTAISGKGLPAMDDDGKSDPYLEMKLRSVRNGKVTNAHPRPQTQVTSAIDKTLSPTWNEKLPFSCSGDDVLSVICYDKDTKGKDYMGEFNVVLSSLDLTPGAPGVKKTFKLQGELDLGQGKKGPTKGEIELGFAIPKA